MLGLIALRLMLSVSDTGPAPQCPAPYNLGADVLSAGLATPDKTALVLAGPDGVDLWGYDRLTAATLGLATALASREMPAGARVLLRLGNTPAFPLSFLAAIAADLVPVPVSSQWTDAELAAAIAVIRPHLIIADPGLSLPETPLPVLSTGDLPPLFDLSPLSPAMGDPDRPGYIIFTSGTSGAPRAVVHAHRALRARRMMWQGWYGLTGQDRVMHAGAFNWTYTLGTGLLDPWAAGATAVIPAPGLAPTDLPALIRSQDATIFAAAPGIFRQMLAATPRIDAPTLRHGLSAGEKLPEITRHRWTAATGTPLHEAFGMSECSTFISGAPDRPAPPDTLGYAQKGRHIAILDDRGAPVPRGTPGRLAIHRDDPGLMLGYLGQPDETARCHAGNWFVTGDRAEMTADGAIRYHGRADDMMNAGGYRVAPLEVETALLAHPAITDCAVTELRIKSDATVIAAFCVSPAPLDEAALSAHMRDRLARYKCPRLYVRVDALARNPNGKIQRRAMAAAYEARE